MFGIAVCMSMWNNNENRPCNACSYIENNYYDLTIILVCENIFGDYFATIYKPDVRGGNFQVSQNLFLKNKIIFDPIQISLLN